jgi:hypothetical protein
MQLYSLQTLIANYNPNNILNMDESHIQFSWDRFATAMFTITARGSSIPPFFIAKNRLPAHFLGQQLELGFGYAENGRTLPSRAIFKAYLEWLSAHLNEPVLLIVDNASMHQINHNDIPTNIRVIHLPPQTTFPQHWTQAGYVHGTSSMYSGGNNTRNNR